MSRIHREGYLFKWFTKNHEITVGIRSVGHGICSVCGKQIPSGNTICDICFEKQKRISEK